MKYLILVCAMPFASCRPIRLDVPQSPAKPPKVTRVTQVFLKTADLHFESTETTNEQ